MVLLSVASAWDMQIKQQLGKRDLRLPLAEEIAGQQQTDNLQVMPVALEHVLVLQDLPAHYTDPFDRLLIAQANVEEAILISHDSIFAYYPVTVL